MTGFGQGSFADRELSADVIVRCVNGKHLKTKVSLGVNMPALAEEIERLTAQHMSRGTVEVVVRLDWAGAVGFAFNERIMAGYARQLQRLAKELGLESVLRADQVALMPGAMVSDGLPGRAAARVWRKIRPAVDEALRRTVRMRASEGRALAAVLRASCLHIRELVRGIESRAPAAALEYRRRLTRRVAALLTESGAKLEPGALGRELILYAERADISEELARMKAHIAHFLAALRGEGVGRKLEFIAQEMHREANTMSSKAADPQMTELVIDLRGEVDKIREQVLNLE